MAYRVRPFPVKVAAAAKVERNFNFLTPPSDALKCLICHEEVATDPWQHDKCGKGGEREKMVMGGNSGKGGRRKKTGGKSALCEV